MSGLDPARGEAAGSTERLSLPWTLRTTICARQIGVNRSDLKRQLPIVIGRGAGKNARRQ
jgi:hypothetical protein